MTSFAAAPDTYLYNEKTRQRRLIIGWVDTVDNPDLFLPIVAYDTACKVTDYEYPWVVSNWPIAVKHIGSINCDVA